MITRGRFDDLFNFSYEKSLAELTKSTAGRKVADCIMTYGFQREDVFAVDRWVRSVNKLNYNSKYNNDKLSVIARVFGSFSSYIQQYIFMVKNLKSIFSINSISSYLF